MTRVFRSISLPFGWLLSALLFAGCSALGPTSPSNPLPNAALTVETFAGTLALNGSAFYSFSVVEGGTTYLTLVSLQEGGIDSNALVSVGLGIPFGTRCVSENPLFIAADGTPQVAGTTGRGVHCVVISDFDGLSQAATFSLNIARPE